MTSSFSQNSSYEVYDLQDWTEENENTAVLNPDPLIRTNNARHHQPHRFRPRRNGCILPVKYYWLIGGILLILFLGGLSLAGFKYSRSGQPLPDQNEYLDAEPFQTVMDSELSLLLQETMGASTLSEDNLIIPSDMDLFTAIAEEDEDAFNSLIETGADVQLKNNRSETLLHIAALCSEKSFGLRIMQFLIENGTDPYAKDDNGYTFLHRFMDDYDVTDRTSLLTSIQFVDLADYLVSKDLTRLFNMAGNFSQKFSTRFIYEYSRSTPFQMAVKNLEIPEATLKLLKTNGVNFNALNSRGDSTLFYALLGKRSLKMLSDLVSLGGNWRHVNKFRQNMIHLAALHGTVKEMKFFLDLGVNINGVDYLGDTPLHVVVYYSQSQIFEKAQFLIRNGADDKILNYHKKIALQDAVDRKGIPNQGKLVELLKNADSHRVQ